VKRAIVVICDQAAKVGGHARVAIESAAGLARAGEDVLYFASHGPIDKDLIDAGVDVALTEQPDAIDEPNPIKGAARGLWNPTARKTLSRLINGHGGKDLIFHIHGWTKSLSASIFPEIFATGRPVVCTLHDYFTACPNGIFFNFRSNRICELEPMGVRCCLSNCDSRSYAHKLWRLGRQFTAAAIAGFPGLVGDYIYTTTFSKSIVGRHLRKDARYHYLPNPVFIDKGPPVDAWNNTAFVYVGRLSPEKGILQAAELTHRLGIPLEIAGSGEIAPQILTANPKAIMHGWLDSRELTALLGRARVLLFPSLWPETYGLTLYEALARGVPVIGSRESAASERIVDDRNGRLFSWKTPEEFENALLSAQDAATVRRWSEFAYSDYWKSPCTIDVHVNGLIGIYDAISRSPVGRD
jgi:glycosyltransferase involved in cell wall biosynthesis